MIPVKSGKRSVFNSERRVAESFTWSLTTTRAEKISGCVKRCFKNASVAPFVVRRFVRSFIRRSFVRSFFRSLARFFVCLLDGRYFSPLFLRSFACSLFIADRSLFTVRRLSFVFCRSFIRSFFDQSKSQTFLSSFSRSIVRSAGCSVGRSLCRSIGQFTEITKLTSTQVKM